MRNQKRDGRGKNEKKSKMKAYHTLQNKCTKFNSVISCGKQSPTIEVPTQLQKYQIPIKVSKSKVNGVSVGLFCKCILLLP